MVHPPSAEFYSYQIESQEERRARRFIFGCSQAMYRFLSLALAIRHFFLRHRSTRRGSRFSSSASSTMKRTRSIATLNETKNRIHAGARTGPAKPAE
jgi:hypothetical protein